jgi:TonB family protein
VRHGLAALTKAAWALSLAALQTASAAAQVPPAPTTVKPPKTCPGPQYPREAIRYELEGITTLRFQLAPDGHVGEVQVAKSSGWALLDDAAIRTLQACGFPPEQAARAKGAALPVQYVWSLDGEHSLRPHLVPGSCPASGRFAGFQAYDNQPSGPDGVKVRLLVDALGQPRGVKTEGIVLPPATFDALIKYVESCRFGFDPELKGQRTDTVFGRVVLAK